MFFFSLFPLNIVISLFSKDFLHWKLVALSARLNLHWVWWMYDVKRACHLFFLFSLLLSSKVDYFHLNSLQRFDSFSLLQRLARGQGKIVIKWMIMTLLPHLHKLTHMHILCFTSANTKIMCLWVSTLLLSGRRLFFPFSAKECIYANKSSASLVHWEFDNNSFDSAIIQYVFRGCFTSNT